MRHSTGLLTLLLCVLTAAMRPGDGRSREDEIVTRPTNAHPGMTKNPDCCLNGGLCVLSFCHCPRHFYGRHCEYLMRQRPCGTIKHATWQRQGCNLCRCVDGILACFSRLFAGCDDVSTNGSAVVYNFRKTKRDQRNSLSTKILLSSEDKNCAKHQSIRSTVITTFVACLVFVYH